MGQKLVSNSRFDPFLEIYLPNTIVGESQVIPNGLPCWIYLNEIPRQASPSVVQIAGFLETVNFPGVGEFRVDYRYATGAVQFNAADRNKIVFVDYQGLGSPLQSEFLDNLASYDPRRSYYTDASRFDDIGDHFPAPCGINSIVRIGALNINSIAGGASIPRNEWYWEVSSPPSSPGTYTGKHEAQIRIAAGGYGYYKSRARYSPGAGILLRTRMKVKPLNVFTYFVDYGMFVGFGSLSSASSIIPLFGFTNLINSPSCLAAVWCATTGGAIVNSVVFPMASTFFDGTVYHDITLIYTPGLLIGAVNGSITFVKSTYFPDLPGHFYMATTSGTNYNDLFVDHVQVRQLLPLVMP